LSLGIILLNWNGAIDTIDCINSLQNSTYKEFYLVIVDNNSTILNYQQLILELGINYKICTLNEKELIDYNLSLKTFEDSAIYVIRNNENWGFAKGNNIGINFFSSCGVQEVLLLNNDTLVTPSFLKKIIDFAYNHPNYMALTPAICYSPPNEDIIWNCGGKITWFGNRRYYFAGSHYDLFSGPKFFEITFITGCALYFKPAKTGLLSEQFFFGEEDFEFSLRLLKSNQKMACVYDALIYHKVGRSLVNKGDISLNALFLHYVSRLINLRGNYKTIFLYLIISINIIHGIYLLGVRYKYGILNSLTFWYKLYRYSKRKEGITKDDFNTIMNFKFLLS
jgi:GT2 family glycosyltransferase